MSLFIGIVIGSLLTYIIMTLMRSAVPPKEQDPADWWKRN
jgi:hypothetical protein